MREPAGHVPRRSSTALELYTRRTDNSDRVLDAVDDPDDQPGRRLGVRMKARLRGCSGACPLFVLVGAQMRQMTSYPDRMTR
jgi:hypothetical protein